MAGQQETETVLVIGATGNIGISAIQGALHSRRNILAIVRNKDSATKISQHIKEGTDRITIVEADIMSDEGVQGVVDQVRAGSLPAFQHVYSAGEYHGDCSGTMSNEEPPADGS